MATETLEVTIEGETLDLEIGTVAAPSGGTSVHNNLTGRDTAAAHPMAAIDGLVAALAAKEASGTAATAVAAHAVAADPHGDRAFATAADAAHVAAADPHGDRAFATSAIATHAAAADPHGDRAFASAADATHVAATDPHGDRAFSVQRANHTGTQLAATISDFNATVDARLAAVDAMAFKGVLDASTNPNYPAGDAGNTYVISVDGKIGGASGPNVKAGDMALCLVDATSAGNHATVGANWALLEMNLDGAVIGPTSTTNEYFTVFDGTSGKLVKAFSGAQVRTALGLVVGTDVQAYSAVLAGTTASFTSAQETKLAGIEALADVTDAGNVGPAIDGTTEKTTPTGADKFPILDSAAAFVLKWMSWTSITTALNALYAGITHATRHQSGGADAIKLDDLAAPDDNTDLDATTLKHGLLPKLGGGTSNFLRADGTWAAPGGGGSPGGSGSELQYRGGASTFSAAAGTHWDAANGRLSIGAGTSPAGVLHVASDSASEVVSIFGGTTSQTGALTQWRNSAGTVLASIDYTGGFNHSNNTAGVKCFGYLANSNAYITTRNAVVALSYGAGEMIVWAGGNPGDLQFTNYNTPITMGTGPVRGKAGTGTNGAGGDLYLAAGRSTGNATPRKVILQSTATGSSGSTAQALVDVLTVTDATTLTANEAVNLAVGTTTGTKLGTATTQKLGFWNATPVVQQAAVADATDAASVITQLNALLAKLRTVGIIAT